MLQNSWPSAAVAQGHDECELLIGGHAKEIALETGELSGGDGADLGHHLSFLRDAATSSNRSANIAILSDK